MGHPASYGGPLLGVQVAAGTAQVLITSIDTGTEPGQVISVRTTRVPVWPTGQPTLTSDPVDGVHVAGAAHVSTTSIVTGTEPGHVMSVRTICVPVYVAGHPMLMLDPVDGVHVAAAFVHPDASSVVVPVHDAPEKTVV